MTQAPEKPSFNTSELPISYSPLESNQPVSATISQKTSLAPIVQWFYNLSIRKKQLLILLGAQTLSIAALLGVGTVEIVNSGRQQLINQSTSELNATEINYRLKIDQMGFGFRGQSDNLAIINAALAKANGSNLTSQQRTIVKQILQNEIKARNIEYATLVGRDQKIIVNANSDRSGETFNPNGLVAEVIKNPRQIKTSEILPWAEINKEAPPLRGQLTPEQDVLIRYTFTPVFSPKSQQVIGVLVSGDVVNGKNTIVETTIQEFKDGYSAIYQVNPDSQTQLINSRGDRENQNNQPLASDKLLQLALQSPEEIVSVRDQVGKQTYTLTAKTIVNQQGETVAVLVRGTSEEALNDVLINSFKSELIIAIMIIIASILLIILMSRAITERIESLEETANDFAQGKYDSRADIVGEDEVGKLAQSLNYLADTIVQNKSILLLDATQAALFQNITGTRTVEEEDVKKVIDDTLPEAKRILNIDRLVIYRFNDDWSGFISNEVKDDDLPTALKEEINDPCIPLELRQAYINGRMVATENVFTAGFAPEHEALMHRLEIKSNLVVPIICQGQLFALLIAHHCREHHSWTEREIAFMEQIAVRYGVILDRVNTIKNRIILATRAEQLKEISTSLADTINRQGVLQRTVGLLRQALSCDRTIVYEFDQSWQGTITAESVVAGYSQALGAQIADPCFADKYVEMYEQGRIQATPDIEKAGLTDCHLQQLRPFSVRANLVAPILVTGKLIGLLICHQCSGARYWQSNEIDLFTQVANQVGLAIERARLLELQEKSEAEQREARQKLQQRALELLMQVDPVSQGDLTIRATVTEDEIGTIADSYNATIANLRNIVSQVQSAALQVAQTTSVRQEEVLLLQDEITQQVQNIAQALQTINVMNNSSRIVAESAQQAEEALYKAQESVESGDSAMNKTVKSILDIRATVEQATEQIKRLGETTENVSKVVGLISRFAAQTHLLALKASIEAARAGEQGQGFAVIADEVRALATQSAQATSDIEKLVADIMTETKTVVMAMEEGSELVVEGSSLVEETRKNLNQITAVTIQVNLLVETIAEAAFEQSENSEEVKVKMTEVADIAGKTNSSVNQLSESFEQLQNLANELQANVSKFKVS